MTRQEAITIFKNNRERLYSTYFSNLVLTALGNKEWGKAASLLLDDFGYTSSKLSIALADAIWEGKK